LLDVLSVFGVNAGLELGVVDGVLFVGGILDGNAIAVKMLSWLSVLEDGAWLETFEDIVDGVPFVWVLEGRNVAIDELSCLLLGEEVGNWMNESDW